MGGSGVTTAVLGDHETISYGPSGWKGLVKDPYIFALSAFASIGGVLFGYDQGVISGVLKMSSFGRIFPILANDAAMQGWMVSVLTLGAMFGAFCAGPISDKFSRRWTMLYANVVFLIGSAIQAAAQNVAMIFVGRCTAGVAVGMISMVVPLYLSELAPPNIRGGLVCLQQLGITVGIMMSFWLNYGTQHIGGIRERQSEAAFRFPLAFQAVPSIILAIGTVFLPYSPRWLMNQDRLDEARNNLMRVRRVPHDDPRISMELLEIQIAQMFESQTRQDKYGTQSPSIVIACREYRDLFTTPHIRKRTIIAILLQVIQQFTGINAIIYYAPTIFEDLGLNGGTTSLLATGVVGIVNFFATIPAVLFMDRWGRKTVLLVGALGMGISQLIVATIYCVYREDWADHPAAGWSACVFIWIYIANFAFSIGCVNWILPSEIFPIAIRGKAVGLAIASNWLSNFVVALIVPRMIESINFGTFYFFLAFCVILFLWVWLCVPETRGIPIEEMDQVFGGSEGEADVMRLDRIRRELGMANSSLGKPGALEDLASRARDAEKITVQVDVTVHSSV